MSIFTNTISRGFSGIFHASPNRGMDIRRERVQLVVHMGNCPVCGKDICMGDSCVNANGKFYCLEHEPKTD